MRHACTQFELRVDVRSLQPPEYCNTSVDRRQDQRQCELFFASWFEIFGIASAGPIGYFVSKWLFRIIIFIADCETTSFKMEQRHESGK